mgnify:CR=1 FL=1
MMSEHERAEWSDEIADLLEAEREAPGAPPALREQVRSRIDGSLLKAGAEATPTAGGSSPASSQRRAAGVRRFVPRGP